MKDPLYHYEKSDELMYDKIDSHSNSKGRRGLKSGPFKDLKKILKI